MTKASSETDESVLAMMRLTGGTEEIFPSVYKELRRLAARQMLREGKNHTLQPTALVNEVFLRLMGDGNRSWDSRAHFFAAAAIAMRRILIEKARARLGKKRGGGRKRVPLTSDCFVQEGNAAIDVLTLDEAISALEQADPRKGQVVKLRYFAGLGSAETAKVMGLSKATVDRDWAFSRAWLLRRIRESSSSENPEG